MSPTTERISHLIERGYVDPNQIAELMASRDAENGRFAAGSPEGQAAVAAYTSEATEMAVAAGIWIEGKS